jgi:hypothetical protein
VVDVRIVRVGWVSRHTVPQSPRVSARITAYVLKLSESNVPATVRPITWVEISAAQRWRSSAKRDRRSAMPASTMPVKWSAASAATPMTPLVSSVSNHWLSRTWYCGWTQVPVPRPSHGRCAT